MYDAVTSILSKLSWPAACKDGPMQTKLSLARFADMHEVDDITSALVWDLDW